ncbi:MAG: NUDIX hydrolase [Planctomycetota bacterium]|nr:NUDIX hydrolase [Planctomycetota bacterium]
MRNRYADGSHSEPYPCDVMSRARVDAVAVVPYAIDGAGVVHVALKEGVRPPVYLRATKALTHPDDQTFLLLPEIVAGVLEPEDTGTDGIARRAALECFEEAGLAVTPESIEPLGGAMFASPGITDEKVYYRAVRVDFATRVAPPGDGSVMEEAGGVVILDLHEAIARCRSGAIPDAKTELALVRLRDRLHGA